MGENLIHAFGLKPAFQLARGVERLDASVTLLALERDETEARAMASRLGISCRICPFSELTKALSPADHLYTVDGAIAQVAALMGVKGRVIMASRLGSRVYRPDASLRPIFRRVRSSWEGRA